MRSALCVFIQKRIVFLVQFYDSLIHYLIFLRKLAITIDAKA